MERDASQFVALDPLGPGMLSKKTSLSHEGDRVIYGEQTPANYLFLVVSGRVVVSRSIAKVGKTVVFDIHGLNDFFGWAALRGSGIYGEQATTLEKTELMFWSSPELVESIKREPLLGLALTQVMVNSLLEARERIESLCLDRVNGRLVRLLLWLAQRFGEQADDGKVHLKPHSQELLAEFVGTSREIINVFMVNLRRQGLVQYSHKGGIIVKVAELEAYLQK